MSRTPFTIKQRDVTAAIKGATAAGLEIARVEVDKGGRVVIVTGKPGELDVTEENPLDAWMARNARQAQGHKLKT